MLAVLATPSATPVIVYVPLPALPVASYIPSPAPPVVEPATREALGQSVPIKGKISLFILIVHFRD